MKLNNMLSDLLSLARQENEPNRYAHSEEYDKLHDELDRKTFIVDELEERAGCSLEVLYRINFHKQIYIDTYVVQRPSGTNMTINPGMYSVRGVDILNNQIQCIAQYSDCYMEFYVPIYEYKVDWFLKEDKSE